MINVVRCGHTFSHRGLLQPARPDVPHRSATKPRPADGDTLSKKRIFRPISPNHQDTKKWTTIAWPTNIQSKTPDGKFGPANIMDGWGNCWFLAPLAAVANDPDGQQILAESIKKANDGYDVTFKGSPDDTVFISDQELDHCLNTNGGDADTRLMELAADKFFKERGHFKSLYFATLIRGGMNQNGAEECLQQFCHNYNISDSMTYNPMREGATNIMACFMLTGMNPDLLLVVSGSPAMQRNNIMAYLNQHTTNDRHGTSIVITGFENPLGNDVDARRLVRQWDVLRTVITSNGTVGTQQRAFLNALDKWLETRDVNNLKVLMSAAQDLRLQHIDLVEFVNTLANNQSNMNQDHFNLLRSGVQEVLGGGPGYIGFSGNHSGTIEGINEAANTFTYSEPNNPTVVHTGELSNLIQEIIHKNVRLTAIEPTTERDDGETSEHAGQKRARHLREIHHQIVRDRKIDPAESDPLANLLEMNDGIFWQAYDSDKNGVIEGSELKAVQLRVDRWVDHFKLSPIW